METTDLEKKSLEAHVDLCAQRYKFLEEKLDTVEDKMTGLERVVMEVHDMLAAMNDRRNDQIIGWGLGIIGTLIAMIGWLVTQYVVK